MNEGWDWTKTQHQRCPQCSFDPHDVTTRRLADEIADVAGRWQVWLVEKGAHPALQHRVEPTRWSALEYACHVRDLFAAFRRPGHPDSPARCA